MRDDAQVSGKARRIHDLAPIEDEELADEEVCRQTNVQLCSGTCRSSIADESDG